MTGLVFLLRRSPRALLARDGYPGPGPGRLAMVMARAGVGKTAFLVGIGIDALLSGQKVLHVSVDGTVDKARAWYDDILAEMLRRERKEGDAATIQLEVERRRHIQAYLGGSFSAERLRRALELLADAMDFRPQVVIVDHGGVSGFAPDTVAAVRGMAVEAGAELWMSCRIHRDGPPAQPGHLPPPADGFEEMVDLALRLDPHEAKIRLHVLKDGAEMVDRDLNLLFDPETQLLVRGAGTAK